MSILSTNSRLIKVGQDYSAGSGISIDDKVISVTGSFGKTYSAGDNIDIYNQGEQLYISSKDWTNDIANASANAYSEAVAKIPDPFDLSFISGQVDNKLDATAFTNWQNGQYSTDLQTIEGQISNKQDSLTFAHGTSSGSISSINGSAIVDDYTYHMLKVTRVATANLYRTITANSGTWNDVSAKVDTTALNSIVDSSTISYNSKPTNNPIYAKENYLTNVNSIDGQNGLLIVPSNILQVPNVITAAPTGVLQVPGVITAIPDGIIASGLTAQNNYGLTANGITANAIMSGFSANGISVGKRGPLCIEGQYEVIDAKGGSGFTFSSQNTNFGTAQLTTAYSNQLVKVNAPKFEARNISGAGFSIEASGAKGYDESGNVVWDTYNPQVKNIISYGDTKTTIDGLTGNIILTVMPSTAQSNISSSPHVIMDASQASYFAAYGPSAYTPTVSLKPDNITFANQVGTSGRATVGCYDIKQEYSGSSWTLTGSIQKRELEYDAETSAITAIAGSAIGGGTGGGDEEVNSFVHNNSATINEVNTTYQTNSGYYQPSGNYIPYTAVDSVFPAFETNSGLEIKTYAAGSMSNTYIKDSHISISYINSKLDINDRSVLSTGSLAFKTNSDSAYVDREKIHTWDSASNYIQNNSATWNDVSTTVQSNSAQWAEGGVTGEFVPQSAFDELKQSYNALSSLFATYSGQWLLPNEGV